MSWPLKCDASVTPEVTLNRQVLAADRWTVYERLRERGPVWSEDFASWFLLDYDSVSAALGSSSFTAAHPLRSSRQIFGPTALDTDGTDHRRYRRQVNWFTPADVDAYRTIVRDEITQVLDDALLDVTQHGEVVLDVSHTVARRLPARVMGRILGLDPDATESAYTAMAPVFAHLDDPRANLMDAVDSADDLLSQLLDAEWAADAVGARLARGERQRRAVSRRDAARQMILMLAAGTLTTAAGISSTLMALSTYDEARALAIAGELDYVVDESLRWRPSLHFTLRYLNEDVEIAGRLLRRGSAVQLGLAAANRDPRRFVDAHRWLGGRQHDRMPSFGGGRHACAGTELARMEIKEVVKGLNERLESWTTAAGPDSGVVFVAPATLVLTGVQRWSA